MATRGITAGSVFATIELRVVIRIFDDICRASGAVIPSVYVDDATLEMVATLRVILEHLARSAIQYKKAVMALGMELSASKNMVTSSSNALAAALCIRATSVQMKSVRDPRSLGSVVVARAGRSIRLQKERLGNFRVRRTQFRKVTHCFGMQRSALQRGSG